MPLSRETVKHYRTLGHDLKPVVMISDNGLSEGVMNELHRALEDHELIKIKVAIADREARKAILKDLTERCDAELVQEIGKMGLIYRSSKKKGIKTSNVR